VTRLVLLFVALGALSVAAPLPFPKKADESDLKKLQGEWQVVQEWGWELRPSATPEHTVRVEGDRMTFLFDGRVKNTCKFTLDPKKSPKAIDLRKVTPSGEVSDGSMLAV
jgi:uncharacterized protein (TIGR03067 family)